MSCEHKICTIHGSFNGCINCFRSTDEIALESQLSALQQQLSESELRDAESVKSAQYWNKKFEDEQGKREQYKARIRLLLKDLDDLQQQRCKGYDAMIVRAEQAEAQAAVMRQQYEQYVKDNCKMIRHGIADGIGKPDDVDGKCGGYSQGCSDEPHDECKLCIAMANNEEYDEELGTAGAELLARVQRYETALNRIAGHPKREEYGCYYTDLVEIAEKVLK